jgi:hypothetical protein
MRLEETERGCNFSARREHLVGVRSALIVDVWKHGFIQVDPDLVPALDRDDLLGDAAFDSFERARPKLREAGNCLAAGCPKASVFHLMRAVEHGLRALASGAGVSAVAVPLDYQLWMPLIEQVESLSKQTESWKGAERTNARQFFRRVIAHLYSFKDDVRNLTMLPGSPTTCPKRSASSSVSTPGSSCSRTKSATTCARARSSSPHGSHPDTARSIKSG